MKTIILSKKKVLFGFVSLLLLVTLATLTGISGYSRVYLGYTARRLPIYSVGTEKKLVALTFDAAWGDSKTESIIAELGVANAKATFFLVGQWVVEHPDKAKLISDAGIEIGTHSNTHPHMNKLNETQMRLELETSVKAIKDATGQDAKVFRPPYGEYCDRLIDVCDSLSIKTIQWDVDTLDWKDLTASEIVNRVVSKVQPGSIVLMHNDGKNTANALPAMLTALKNKGYTFVSVSEMLAEAAETAQPDHTGRLK